MKPADWTPPSGMPLRPEKDAELEKLKKRLLEEDEDFTLLLLLAGIDE